MRYAPGKDGPLQDSGRSMATVVISYFIPVLLMAFSIRTLFLQPVRSFLWYLAMAAFLLMTFTIILIMLTAAVEVCTRVICKFTVTEELFSGLKNIQETQENEEK